ncbi:hypothetical protein C8R44DRAFT_752007 [Mycena epipterygia]|nr:hypothetical protein C8R44DRAFT_752007 [Mycena epipterygia]
MIPIRPEGEIRGVTDDNPSSVDGSDDAERKSPPRPGRRQASISRGPQGLASLQALVKSGLKGEPGGNETRHGAASRARAAPLILPGEACRPTPTGGEQISEGMRHNGHTKAVGRVPEQERSQRAKLKNSTWWSGPICDGDSAGMSRRRTASIS